MSSKRRILCPPMFQDDADFAEILKELDLDELRNQRKPILERRAASPRASVERGSLSSNDDVSSRKSGSVGCIRCKTVCSGSDSFEHHWMFCERSYEPGIFRNPGPVLQCLIGFLRFSKLISCDVCCGDVPLEKTPQFFGRVSRLKDAEETRMSPALADTSVHAHRLPQ